MEKTEPVKYLEKLIFFKTKEDAQNKILVLAREFKSQGYDNEECLMLYKGILARCQTPLEQRYLWLLWMERALSRIDKEELKRRNV